MMLTTIDIIISLLYIVGIYISFKDYKTSKKKKDLILLIIFSILVVHRIYFQFIRYVVE